MWGVLMKNKQTYESQERYIARQFDECGRKKVCVQANEAEAEKIKAFAKELRVKTDEQ